MDEIPFPPPDDTTPDADNEEPSEELGEAELFELLGKMRAEHRAIDNEIKASFETGVTDMLKIKRMKKIKLAMKDKIAFLENQLTPDIIA